ncbi:Murein DD-endopeptidase MepM and murein hydrolase activator NlpD, contain LysM domain [Muriicola jejuensis]|uniref:Peptidoglycan DD-metalloendopeptidase family protein n=1 Tax=Muriicola jejuensis TaxID=504488 RepID=A0A6P0UG41_9FLAO|nr:peptidoglycan DD-metalloendopeptidase family protein [Muriicola jejuensis]NER10193.1 peptidoglycan DD-metalloendopeptidase family protein [Muriicola jejuensis]SMP02297.1 Murein DD-endopeptidase MepM and murein hydrolase activator NlpD, contain LysM domain [Muriicola jejuensis]
MRKYWGLFLACILLSSCGEDKPATSEADLPEEHSKSVSTKPAVKYGFDLSNFIVVEDTIRKGDIFGELMTRNKVDYPKIYELTQKFKDTFDVRRIRVGNPYTILKSKDTSEVAQLFIYENDPVNYTVVDFRDTVLAYKGRKKVKLVEREASGIIPRGGSLSDVIVQENIDYLMVNELSGIYAWTIDFFKLDAGDKFRIIYDEKYINDSIYAGAGSIKAAYFEHKGEPFYAFAYHNDSLDIKEYYDHEANNLRRTFLRAPLKFGRLSSRYNLKRRIRYYGYKVRPHKGTDYAAPIGTPILATADGVVTESTRRGGNGKYVKIRHNGTYSTQYLHMKAQNVRQGQYVRQGDVIGWIGMTGNTGGPHVCYRFWKNGRQVDPLREELPVAEPLAEILRPAYYEYMEPVKTQLDCIEYSGDPSDQLLTLNP